jgi:hypothetical protein
MIEVKLRTNWFGPDGGLYKSSRNPHRFVDEWEKFLPKTAKISKADEDDETPKAPAPKK